MFEVTRYHDFYYAFLTVICAWIARSHCPHVCGFGRRWRECPHLGKPSSHGPGCDRLGLILPQNNVCGLCQGWICACTHRLDPRSERAHRDWNYTQREHPGMMSCAAMIGCDKCVSYDPWCDGSATNLHHSQLNLIKFNQPAGNHRNSKIVKTACTGGGRTSCTPCSFSAFLSVFRGFNCQLSRSIADSDSTQNQA